MKRVCCFGLHAVPCLLSASMACEHVLSLFLDDRGESGSVDTSMVLATVTPAIADGSEGLPSVFFRFFSIFSFFQFFKKTFFNFKKFPSFIFPVFPFFHFFIFHFLVFFFENVFSCFSFFCISSSLPPSPSPKTSLFPTQI